MQLIIHTLALRTTLGDPPKILLDAAVFLDTLPGVDRDSRWRKKRFETWARAHAFDRTLPGRAYSPSICFAFNCKAAIIYCRPSTAFSWGRYRKPQEGRDNEPGQQDRYEHAEQPFTRYKIYTPFRGYISQLPPVHLPIRHGHRIYSTTSSLEKKPQQQQYPLYANS